MNLFDRFISKCLHSDKERERKREKVLLFLDQLSKRKKEEHFLFTSSLSFSFQSKILMVK